MKNLIMNHILMMMKDIKMEFPLTGQDLIDWLKKQEEEELKKMEFSPRDIIVSKDIVTGQDLIDWLEKEHKELKEINFKIDFDEVAVFYIREPNLQEIEEQRKVFEKRLLKQRQVDEEDLKRLKKKLGV